MVIVGGGATGVELAAELAERMEIVSSYDSAVERTTLKLSLVETSPRVLGSHVHPFRRLGCRLAITEP